MSSRPDGAARSSQPAAQRQRWRLGFGALAWRAEDRAYAGVLEALTRERAQVLRQTQELISPAAPLTRRGIDAELERGARAELAALRAALEDARTRSGADGKSEVAY